MTHAFVVFKGRILVGIIAGNFGKQGILFFAIDIDPNS